LLIVGERDPVVIGLNCQAAQKLGGEARLEIIPGASHLFEEPGTFETAGSPGARLVPPPAPAASTPWEPWLTRGDTGSNAAGSSIRSADLRMRLREAAPSQRTEEPSRSN
jgi:hypothetical protein